MCERLPTGGPGCLECTLRRDHPYMSWSKYDCITWLPSMPPWKRPHMTHTCHAMVKLCLHKGQNSSNIARSLAVQSSWVLPFHFWSGGPAILMPCIWSQLAHPTWWLFNGLAIATWLLVCWYTGTQWRLGGWMHGNPMHASEYYWCMLMCMVHFNCVPVEIT